LNLKCNSGHIVIPGEVSSFAEESLLINVEEVITL
jgi:hypothetical protein